MYIERLRLDNIRSFTTASIEFVHPDRWGGECPSGLPKPRLPNVNLLLGDNGSGKTTLLEAIALAAFGPAAERSNLEPRNLVRLSPRHASEAEGRIILSLLLHEQDHTPHREVESALDIRRMGELEDVVFTGLPGKEVWAPVFKSDNVAFLVVGYGATRRVEPGESLDMGARTKSRFRRAQRVQSLFQDSHSLIPLTYWLPKLENGNPGRHVQVVHLIDRLLKPTRLRFTGTMVEGDYVFERAGTEIPFQSLSDGYRAFIGWVADLLYHIWFACPSGKKLVDTRGVVLVDEIDLHLHPKWQMKVVETVAKALPRMQFIFTSHSPLIAGSLEWMNVVRLKLGARGRASVKRLEESLHGLDVDQILLTDLFGLTSTRAAPRRRTLDRLKRAARTGDKEAARRFLRALSTGMEPDRAPAEEPEEPPAKRRSKPRRKKK